MAATRPTAAILLTAALAGCGSDPPARDPTPAAAAGMTIPLGPAPPGVAQLCGIAALDKEQVLCPTRFPRARSRQADGRLLSTDRDLGYLIEWRITGFRRGIVRAGGQPGRVKLPGPRKVLRRGVRIGTSRGTVVSTRGHVAVLWNQNRRGYVVSLHFGDYPLRDRVAAAIGMARSSAPARPGGGCDPGGPTDCG